MYNSRPNFQNVVYKEPSYDITAISCRYQRVIDNKRVTTHRWKNPFYDNLKAKYPNLAKYTNSQIKKYIFTFNQELWKETLVNKNGVKLPEYMGLLIVVTYGNKSRSVNKYESLQQSKKVYYNNDHSQNYIGWACWIPRMERYYFENCELWNFQPHTNYTDALANVYKSGHWKRFIVVKGLKYVENTLKYDQNEISGFFAPPPIKNI